MTEVSKKGLAFIASHEGFVGRAYLDPVGIITIGYGFTMRSGVFKAWAKEKWGRSLRMGDRVSRSDADVILRTLLAEEYEPPVRTMIGDLPQHQHDACASACYNLGPRCLKWKWAQALKKSLQTSSATGQRSAVRESARLLRKTGTTAAGRTLAGLVRRRKEEAALIEHGVYSTGNARHVQNEDIKKPEPDVMEAQELLKGRGIDPGAIDGIFGPKTRAAILAYQALHPHLENDGVLGPATLTQLRKDASMVKRAVESGAKKLVPTATGVGGLSYLSDLPWIWIAAGVVVAGIALFAWHNRDIIGRRLNKMSGRTAL
ncbi:MAG: peptidoglycan-binding protein [Roseibium sp.]|nr:peptidoglycan-binding protein [Roseibium sp.]